MPHGSSAPTPAEVASTSTSSLVEDPYVVLLFDDPVNTMAYVASALRAVLKVDGPTAEHLMLEAHNNGKAAVFSGPQAEAERVCVDLHGWTLNATVVK